MVNLNFNMSSFYWLEENLKEDIEVVEVVSYEGEYATVMFIPDLSNSVRTSYATATWRRDSLQPVSRLAVKLLRPLIYDKIYP